MKYPIMYLSSGTSRKSYSDKCQSGKVIKVNINSMMISVKLLFHR